MITITKMENIDKELLQLHLKETGTIIVFPNNDSLLKVIEENFKTSNERKTPPNLNDLIYIVFGRFPIKIQYINDRIVKDLIMYNYFEGINDEFYLGRDKKIIHHYINSETGEERYILHEENNNIEIGRKGRGYDKFPSKNVRNLNWFKLVGEF